MKIIKLLPLLFTVFLMSGCIAPHSFIDPNEKLVSIHDLKTSTKKPELNLQVIFLRNGEPFTSMNKPLEQVTERLFNESGIIKVINDPYEDTIKITVNNIADVGAALAKGFGTGLTFGAVGTTVVDFYQCNVEIIRNGKSSAKMVKGELFTSIGNVELPVGTQLGTSGEIFLKVYKQMVIKALMEFQKNGEL